MTDAKELREAIAAKDDNVLKNATSVLHAEGHHTLANEVEELRVRLTGTALLEGKK